MITTWMEWLLWIAVIGSVVSALWGAVYLSAHRMTWILGDLTIAAFALFVLFRASLSEAATNIVLALLLAWGAILMITNWRTRLSIKRAGK